MEWREFQGLGHHFKSLKKVVPSENLKKRAVALLVILGCLVSLEGCRFQSKKEPALTLHLSTPAKIKGLDPIHAQDAYSSVQISQAYETLLQYHYLKRPYILIPSLAESMPEVSQDGRTYLFRLKKGVLFQDDPCFKSSQGKGRELVAEDVIYSFKRLADPRLGSSGWWLFDGKIVGLNEWRKQALSQGKADYGQPVEGLKAIDRHTLQITLVSKSQQFLYALAMAYTAIVPSEAVEFYGKDFVNHPVGTGPFRLEEYQPNSKIIWVRSPSYRGERYPSEGSPADRAKGLLADAGKPMPFVDQVTVQVMIEQQPAWLNFLSGKIDLSAIPKDNFSAAITPAKELHPDLSAKGVQLTKTPDLDIAYATFNMDDPLVGKNKYLRQALSLAYDEESFINLFYNGRAVSAQGPIPPGLEEYDPQLKNPYRNFSITQAKERLAKAGYPDGKNLPPIEYAALEGSFSRQLAEHTQKMMAAIGVQLKVTTYSWPQFLEMIRNRKAQLWEHVWVADYPDAENFLQLFYSKNGPPGPNDAHYSNPEFDRLYEKSLSLPKGSERTALYRKMVEMVIEDCPWIFGSHRLSYVLNQKWIKNYKPHDFEHSAYKYYRVEPDLKSE